MTRGTACSIEKFVETRDIDSLPSIIIALQEEDNVSEATGKRNCFKLLRNMAAHHPAELIEQLKESEGCGAQRIVMKTEQKSIGFDILAVSLALMEMENITGDAQYSMLVQALLGIFYGKIFEKYANVTNPFIFVKQGSTVPLIANFLAWQEYMYEKFGRVKTISAKDEYQCSMYLGNPKVFWKVAIPDMGELLIFIFSKATEGDQGEGKKFILNLYDVRDV